MDLVQRRAAIDTNGWRLGVVMAIAVKHAYVIDIGALATEATDMC